MASFDEDGEDSVLDFCLDITGENLEDLLAYDDLFLDYFNTFLSLPVFPQPLVYDRLTGAFEEVDDGIADLSGSFTGNNPASLHYGPTDEEREKMLEWAREERLPLFLKTQLFRELKLQKLLLRPLDDRNSASRGSSRNISVRGYSRQTETYVSSLSNSVDNSGNDILGDEDDLLEGGIHYSALYPYQRPGSRALSMPIKVISDDIDMYYDDESSIRSASTKHLTRVSTSAGKDVQKSSGKQADTSKRTARISNLVEVITPGKSRSSQRTKAVVPQSSTEEAFQKGARALSAPVNYEQFLKMPHLELPDFDAMFGEDEPEATGQTYVTFDDDHISDEQNETDMKNMEGRLKMTTQQMKEQALSSRQGFVHFQEFLSDTSGYILLEFWVDCENFKDTMEDFDEHKQKEIISMLYRDVQDKYKLKLTQDAKDQITRSTCNMELTHTIFLRTQYDVLRRLRAYWLPRYLTHCECTNTLNLESKELEPVIRTNVKPLRSRLHSAIFPSISIARSMPVLPEDARDFSFSMMGAVEARSGLKRANSSMSVRSGQSSYSNRSSWLRRTLSSASVSHQLIERLRSRSTKERFLQALAQDKTGGGPFQRFLSKRAGNEQLLSCLLFWQDVTEYGAAEDRSADRLLRLCHAWMIYNKYLSEDSPYKVELSEKERINLHKTLQSARDFIEASVFHTAKTQAVAKLETAWIRFLKEDLKTFLDCRVRVGADSPPSTAEAIEITVTDQDVLIKRPRPWVRRFPGSAATERAIRLQKALVLAEDIDEDKRAEKKKEALERRKEMERERRKAIKAAYARQREAGKKKPGTAKTERGTSDVGFNGEKSKEDDKSVTYQELSGNRQVMTMFKKYLSDASGKEVQTHVQLFQELEGYFTSKDSKSKKEAIAAHIYKTYLDPQSKKSIQTNEQIMQALTSEKDRPKSATLREVQQFLQPKVEETFKEFITQQAEELNVEPQDLAKLSQAELAMRMNSDPSIFSSNKRKGKQTESVKQEEKKKEEKDINKIGTLQFSSVKVNLYEDANVGKLSKMQPVSQSSKGVPNMKVKTIAFRAFSTISESQELVLSDSRSHGVKGSSQGTASGLASTDGQVVSSRIQDTPLNFQTPRKGRRSKQTMGRAQPSREDKNEFLHALGLSAAGHLSIQMLYFYKYLLKYGAEESSLLLHKDLFFYIEVQKFKECSHAYSDEEMMKRKVQSILDCFLDSFYTPSLQIDVTAEVHQKTSKAAQKYLSGKEVVPTLFDEAQFCVFKELLPYWAGFRKSFVVPVDPKKKPVTKYDKMLKKRMDIIENYKTPAMDFSLPSIPEGAIPSYTITLSDGVKYREIEDNTAATPLPDVSKDRRASRQFIASSMEGLNRKGRRMSIKPDPVSQKETLMAK